MSRVDARSAELSVHDFTVASEPGIDLFVRRILPAGEGPARRPLLLVHGGGPGGLASFDLPVPGYSLARDFAAAGHPVYVMDVRGWGASTRPAALEQSASASRPAVTWEEASSDVGAVVAAISADHHSRGVALLGWASGGHWGAAYAASDASRVSRLVLLNTLYSVDGPWSLRGGFEDPRRPGQFDAHRGAYSLRTAASLLAGWDGSIPIPDKTGWRDPRVAAAYAREALASDPTSDSRTPPSVRVPSGFQLEAYEMSRGRVYWRAADIRVPTLVVRGERDFWSRPVDVVALMRALPNGHAVTIPDATHYLFNDRPERGRVQFLGETLAFLADHGD